MEIVWKVCRACDGKGFTKANGEQISTFLLESPPIVCVDCDGKGLEVNKMVDTDREEV